MTEYSELLKDPRWQRKRLEIFHRDDWKCTRCGRGYLPLAVHHTVYHRGKNPWEYHNDDLQTVCVPCHNYVIHYEKQPEEGLTLISGSIEGVFEGLNSAVWLSSEKGKNN